MRPIKTFFMRRQMREKLILTVFVAAIALVWLNAFWSRGSLFATDAKTLRATLAEQRQWLDRQDSIESATKKALSTLEVAKSLNANTLSAALYTVAQGAGLAQNQYTYRYTGAKASKQFTVHSGTITLNVQNTAADWTKVQEFYKALEKQAPYITFTSPFTVQGSGGGGGGGPGGRGGGGGSGNVSATIKVTAVELKP